jgi:hypothetical protein
MGHDATGPLRDLQIGEEIEAKRVTFFSGIGSAALGDCRQ